MAGKCKGVQGVGKDKARKIGKKVEERIRKMWRWEERKMKATI